MSPASASGCTSSPRPRTAGGARASTTRLQRSGLYSRPEAAGPRGSGGGAPEAGRPASELEAVDGSRDLLGDEAVAEVVEHELAGPAPRVAVAAAVRGEDADHVALVHLERRHDRVVFDRA